MAAYTVDPDALAAVAAATSAGAAAGRQELVALAGRVADVLERGWVSPAGRQFGRGWHEWRDAVEVLLADLDALASAIAAAARGYATTEASVGAAIGAAL